jgi:non-specific serine/threonine protein kinase
LQQNQQALSAFERVGQALGRYRILEVLDEGGMGIVYKAEDTRLNRAVALKVIAPHRMRDAEAKERFIQEARAASRLDHPNICTIHEVEETPEGELFLVMTFYDGQTVARRLVNGPLQLSEALEITRQLLRGLAAAHAARIVHRDIKPANLILTSRGDVKILDFGLAKPLAAAEASEDPTQGVLTQPGTVLGTRVYMSPEQCRGLDVDHRSDLWSAGVTLYEMLTGRVPFRGPDQVATLYAICHEEPAPLEVLRPDVPAALGAVLRRALAKSPQRRYASADEFARDLDHAAGAGSAAGSDSRRATSDSMAAMAPSILVLPFANLSAEPESDYFSEGLTDEIITDLSSVQALRVISRTSAMQLKGTGKDIRTIGRDLEVQYVLEGTVRRVGNALRITAKLIDAVLDNPLWAQKYSGDVQDVFDIQERISRAIVAALQLKLSSREDRRLAARPLEDIQAYEFYLRARQELFRFSADALDRARDYLGQGMQIVGDSLMLRSALGYAHWQYVNTGASTDPSHLHKARECALRCLELDPESPHGHRLLGLIALKNGTIQEVVRHLKRARQLDPNDSETLFWLAVMLGFAGRAEVGGPVAERLLKIDPLTPMYQVVPGWLALMKGDFARAPQAFRRAIEMDATNPILRVTYGHILALNGRGAEACEVFDALARDQPTGFFTQMGRVVKAALLGQRETVLAGVTEELQIVCSADCQYAWMLAECFTLVGEKDAAAGWLAKAVASGCWNYRLLAEWDPFLGALRGEPAFERVLEELKPAWEAFEA